jgi:CHAT domain-containing protein
MIGYSDKSIPLAGSEVKAVKRKLDKKAISFAGRRAKIRAFLENAPNADLIHLACHGQFRSDNPMFSSLHLADGWVTVRDVARQKLKARLVILSACETGLGEIQKGEELLGLTRGFLSAGAQNLIVSLWTVNDESTSRLMSDIYTNLQLGDTPAASLRAAQMKFIARGIHPYFWSPFVSIGQ